MRNDLQEIVSESRRCEYDLERAVAAAFLIGVTLAAAVLWFC